MLLIMLVAGGVGAKSLPFARGGVRGGTITCQIPLNFSAKNLEYIYMTYVILYLMFIAFMNKVNFHEHFFIILDS